MFLDRYAKNWAKKAEKEELLTTTGYVYYCDILFEKCVRIFEWNGLPFPQKEIEMRLIYDGFCGFVKDRNCGLMVATGSMSGPTQYFDEFKNFTYAAATARGGTYNIGEDCVVIDNTALRNSMYPMISRYASMLAHADTSIKCALINLRTTNTFAVEDDDTEESVRSYYNDVYEGKSGVIVDESMVDAVKNIASTAVTSLKTMDAIDARNEILRAFYGEIGVRYSRDKKERMVADEVTTDNQMLLLNVKDMLKQRQKACEEINRIFGLNVSVNLSPEFEMIDEMGIEEVADDEG